MIDIKLTKDIFGELKIDHSNLLGVYEPRDIMGRGLSDSQISEKIKKPLGTVPFSEIAKGCKRVLIVTDDNTRQTPLSRIIPCILTEIESSGIKKENITILIGLGTHRGMTKEEILDKFGDSIANQYRIENHEWNNPDHLFSLGHCDLGFEVIINRLIKDSDLIISVGCIVPHATAGFSGGGKTIMPGICGEKTIEDTHWAALEYNMSDILGNSDNKVRRAIVSISRKAGLKMIVNAVLFNENRIYDIVSGDVEIAHLKGIEKSKEVYGVNLSSKADIVIAEAYPNDIDLRQAIKALCSADIICRDGGVIILPAECPEGISPQFPDFQRYGFKNPDRLYNDVENGRFKQKLMAYSLVAIGRIISKRVKAILVSPNINSKHAEQMGFIWAADLQDSLNNAFQITGKDSKVIALKQAGELLPILQS